MYAQGDVFIAIFIQAFRWNWIQKNPIKIAKAVNRLNLNYAVITSVTRDDLPDLGAEQFYNTVMEIRKLNPDCKVEILTPDFNGNIKLLELVLGSTPYIFNHNIEVSKRTLSQY